MADSLPEKEVQTRSDLHISQILSSLPEGFWDRMVAELDNDDVTAIFLHGSYARGEATPYSDIDLVRLVKEESEQSQRRQYIYREGYLVSIATRPLSTYWQWFTMPERAIFVVPGILEARVLLDKVGAFNILQQRARAFRWEPLQEAANYYASQLILEQTEIVHKTLRALLLQDMSALSEMILILFNAITDAVSVQRAIFARSGNSYFQQVQESIGQKALWTQYHRTIAGIDPTNASLEKKGEIVLRLYQETVKLLFPYLQPAHRDTIKQTSEIIEVSLSHKINRPIP